MCGGRQQPEGETLVNPILRGRRHEQHTCLGFLAAVLTHHSMSQHSQHTSNSFYTHPQPTPPWSACNSSACMHRYALNVWFNLLNKSIFKYFPFPYTVSTVHVIVGTAYCALVYIMGLKKWSFGRVRLESVCVIN